MFCEFIKKIDLYGKDPEFYYKGNPSKTTWIGRILTIVYVIIYIAFLVYKLERMIKRVDVTFYETTAFTGEIPSIQLSKEIFYGAFAFNIPGTETPYANDHIYTIDAKYVSQVKVNGQWNVTETPIPFKHCELSDFGSNYQNIVGNRDLSGMWCPTNVDFVLEGYTTLDRYSYLKLNFKPCRDTPENPYCAPTNDLMQMLYATSINSIIEDIELTPRDHDHPIQRLERDIPGPTYLNLYQMIYVYMQLIIIETDDNIIGFEALSNTKSEKHLKYDTSWIISRPILFDRTVFDPVAPADDLNDITIQLSPTVLTQKRTYVQLIDVLGDVGGLMEIVNMIFSVIASLIVNILYEESLVNNLFNFDLDKKVVMLKNNQIKKSVYENEDGTRKTKKQPTREVNCGQNIGEGNKNEEIEEKNNENNYEIIAKNQRKKAHSKKDVSAYTSEVSIYQRKNKSSKRNLYDIKENKEDYLNDMNAIGEKKDENKEYIDNNQFEMPEERMEESQNMVKKIEINKFFVHCGFCCVRSVSNMNNTLLDEGMKLIMEHLDVFNIFRKLYIGAKTQQEIKEKAIMVEMTDECKKNVVMQLRKMKENVDNSASDIS